MNAKIATCKFRWRIQGRHNDAHADFAVPFYVFQFIWIKLAGLEQDRVGDADFAHVVQLRRQFQHGSVLLWETKLSSNDPGAAADADDVLARIVVAILGRPRQALDHLKPREL